MKQVLCNIRSFFVRHNPAIERRYDVSTKVYKNNKDAEPAFHMGNQGSWRISLWQGVLLAISFFALIALLSPKKK